MLSLVKSNIHLTLNEKFLGIFIDPALNFKYHVEKMTRKLATALFFMRNAKHFLNVESMKSLYYSIFHSVVVYGIHVWSSTANTNLQGIILKQKAAVRTICGARYNDKKRVCFMIKKGNSETFHEQLKKLHEEIRLMGGKD